MPRMNPGVKLSVVMLCIFVVAVFLQYRSALSLTEKDDKSATAPRVDYRRIPWINRLRHFANSSVRQYLDKLHPIATSTNLITKNNTTDMTNTHAPIVTRTKSRARSVTDKINTHAITHHHTVTTRPKIVFWAKQHHSIDWKFDELLNGDGGCEVSFQRSDATAADALIFFAKSCKPDDLPQPHLRKANQVYVWFSHESPWTTGNYYGRKLTEYNDFFNWTMTYRTDSDVLAAMWPTPAMDYLLYRTGRAKDMVDTGLTTKAGLGLTHYREQITRLLKIKQDFVAWIASDCHITKGASKRLEAVRKLEDTGLKLTKYGKCAGRPLSFNFTILFQTLSTYKFYLALENSLHCTDYLTEKTIFNSFISGTVPVIHGPRRTDVEKILPRGSYIFVEDFQTPQYLTDYLSYLDRNDTAYIEYFKWWTDPGAQTFPRYGFNFGTQYMPRVASLPEYTHKDVQDDWLEYERFGLYHLCRRLKRGDHLNKEQSIPNLANWWYGSEPPECRN